MSVTCVESLAPVFGRSPLWAWRKSGGAGRTFDSKHLTIFAPTFELLMVPMPLNNIGGGEKLCLDDP